MNLENLIKNKQAKVVIIGMGYVGLPHAVEIAKVGFDVSGIDIQEDKVVSLNQGNSYIEDIKDKDLQAVIDSGKFKAFSDCN